MSYVIATQLRPSARAPFLDAIGTMIRPLIRPTIAGLGTAIAGWIVGQPPSSGTKH